MTSDGQDSFIHFQAKLEDAAYIELVVVVPTFRRPHHIVKTLKTIVSQRPDVPLATIVVENDAEGLAGAQAAKNFFSGHSFDCVVAVARRLGHAHACNAGLTAALDLFPNVRAVAFIYDDEVAAPEWLSGLMAVQEAHDADIVGGPQLPVFGHPQEQKWKRHPVFAPPYNQNGPVPALYSAGNVLVTRRVLDGMPRPFLDPALNVVGIGDADFFDRCRAKGFSFAWAADAWVAESVPAHHTTASWTRARSLEKGAISALMEHPRDATFTGRLKSLRKSLRLLISSLPVGVSLWAETGLAAASLYPLHVAIGRLTARIGPADTRGRDDDKA
ncbi:glycosyltransferase family 2 protein [Sinorhizobium medicae]|uniref:glycosyltransferase family 2 protein n=1 Tax=Sinorhizobium medicae TaxID=110321 RepID=UPI000C7C5EFC|nr:glycosyltransferase [Sinorhizobium medicae]MDX0422323.1 glycosyltransferase [Sinorhizobium medicae]PLT94491.1 glycosyl transferase [Sinorhizobium medicae]PLU57919.1 glycosyl transferase [Sinorhizobium medicae]PLU70605.1 glycosyl transferase [Sinorhizobium medicae]TWA19969.1 glycosyl transferase family 2 [Sinorhizobium medicae]